MRSCWRMGSGNLKWGVQDATCCPHVIQLSIKGAVGAWLSVQYAGKQGQRGNQALQGLRNAYSALAAASTRSH